MAVNLGLDERRLGGERRRQPHHGLHHALMLGVTRVLVREQAGTHLILRIPPFYSRLLRGLPCARSAPVPRMRTPRA